ncbi:hypothetical protein M405DRAFT_105398 [Rhizopogon salebrosus TDB-379]|nr:hypothetical protein M405DRAFT_105398 [Rhizopogon salebrosus TDB-379]
MRSRSTSGLRFVSSSMLVSTVVVVHSSSQLLAEGRSLVLTASDVVGSHRDIAAKPTPTITSMASFTFAEKSSTSLSSSDYAQLEGKCWNSCCLLFCMSSF